jgi:hypothetical protein
MPFWAKRLMIRPETNVANESLVLETTRPLAVGPAREPSSSTVGVVDDRSSGMPLIQTASVIAGS